MRDRDIDEFLNRSGQALPKPGQQVLGRIAESVRADLAPVKPLPPQWRLNIGLILICTAVALTGATISGAIGFSKMDLLMRVCIFAALGIVAWMVSHAFVVEMIPGAKKRFTAGQLLLTGCFFLFALFASMFRDYQITQFFSTGVVCLGTGVAYAVAGAVGSWLLLRRGYAVNPIRAGMLAGMLGGMAGITMLELHCPNFQAAHILVWHVAVVPVSAGLGVLAAGAFRRLARRQ